MSPRIPAALCFALVLYACTLGAQDRQLVTQCQQHGNPTDECALRVYGR
jgi:hypothetical protein